MIKLGSFVKDPITGLRGMAIARSEWLWGCTRIGVQPQELKDGRPVEETWFDEARLEIVVEAENKVTAAGSGGPRREGGRVTEG